MQSIRERLQNKYNLSMVHKSVDEIKSLKCEARDPESAGCFNPFVKQKVYTSTPRPIQKQYVAKCTHCRCYCFE